VEAAREKGIERIIANHPLSKNSCRYTVAEAKQLADLGATVELTFVSMMPFTRAKTSTPKETVEAIREIGAERCIISTDFGAYATPPPPEGLRMFIATLLNHGMEPEEVDCMARRNPTKLAAL
jgi:microsomal dipeptidase-like Zn-dependent dipeptidase